MYINSTSQAAGRMLIGGREVKPGGPTMPDPVVTEQVRKAEEKNTLYDNFSREMDKRLKKTGTGQSEDSAQALVKSLTGAMGEIENAFGREAATMVMARILTGTASGADEGSLITSLQNGLAELSRKDPTVTKLKELTKSFNQDLALALDSEAADRKHNDASTLSLSYVLARHFGSLDAEKIAEVKEVSKKTENTWPPALGINLAITNLVSNSAPPQTQSGTRDITTEIYEMFGFNEDGRWDAVEVAKLDQATADEVKETAEYGLAKAREITLAKLIKADGGIENSGGKFLHYLAEFLEKTLDDQEAAKFIEKAIFEGGEFADKGWGTDPKLADVLSKVYSKIAAEGDADKLNALEHYINNDFKEALNPVLAEYSRTGEDVSPDLVGLVGELQFKGLGGASQAEESDVFSLSWGYKDNSVYDQTTAKHFLQEDFQAVKAVKKKSDEADREKWAREWDKALHDRPLTGRKAADEPATATFMDKFNAERRQSRLAELIDTKFGQLNNTSQEKLAQYIKDHFNEYEAEKLLEHTKWNKNLMGGLAALYRDMQALGANDGQMADFMNFLNDHLKRDVENVAQKLGGPAFEGWQTPEGTNGDLTASFTFAGQETTRVSIKALEQSVFLPDDPGLSIAQQTFRDALAASPYGRHQYGSGCLVNQEV